MGLLVAAFAALAGLVAAGSLTRLDEWAIDHAMPGENFARQTSTFSEALVPLLHARWHPLLHGVAEIVTVPASVLPSLVIAGAGCLVLWRRGRRPAALAWAAAWVAGTTIEVATKAALTRPELFSHGVHVVGFDSSFPSGHTIRAVLVAATIAVAWPAARIWVAAWAVCAVVLIEVAGFHTPSDIAGGLVLVALLVELARRYGSG